VQLDSTAAPVTGMAPTVLIVPIFVIAAVALLGMFVSALQAMTQEEFGAGPQPTVVKAAARLPRPRTSYGSHVPGPPDVW